MRVPTARGSTLGPACGRHGPGYPLVHGQMGPPPRGREGGGRRVRGSGPRGLSRVRTLFHDAPSPVSHRCLAGRISGRSVTPCGHIWWRSMTLALISVNQSLARAHHALRPRTLPSHAFIDRRGVAILPGARLAPGCGPAGRLEAAGHGRRGTVMDLSWACGRPTVAPALRRCSARGSNIPVTSASAGRESLSDGGFQAEGDRPRIPTLLYKLRCRC